MLIFTACDNNHTSNRTMLLSPTVSPTLTPSPTASPTLTPSPTASPTLIPSPIVKNAFNGQGIHAQFSDDGLIHCTYGPYWGDPRGNLVLDTSQPIDSA